MWKAVIAVIAIASMGGCATAFLPIHQIRDRAAFDFSCPARKVSVQWIPKTASAAVATGCNKTATYVHLKGAVLLNSAIHTVPSTKEHPAAAPTPAPAPQTPPHS